MDPKFTDTIPMSQAKSILGFRDNRSFLRWCSTQHVAVFAVPGTTKRFVLRHEFDAARLATALPYLRERYGVHAIDAVNTLLTVQSSHRQAVEKRNTVKPAKAKVKPVPVPPAAVNPVSTESLFITDLLNLK